MTQTPIHTDEPHALPGDAVAARLGTDTVRGLPEAEVLRRRAVHGPNALAVKQGVGLARLLLRQVESPVVFLLLGAALLAAAFGETEEALAVGVVLALNTLIGFLTEFKATRSIEALRRLETQNARVRRDGHDRMIPADELVPGDIVLLEAGDAVPADLRLIEGSTLQADESTLTGESVPVAKHVAPVPAGAALGDRASMLYRGTAVTRGTALGVTVATGAATEIGKVSQLVAEAGAGASPIERKLTRLSAQLVWATLALAAAIAGIGVATGQPPLMMVEAAIALAVAAIPEGLPIVATLVLARGMWRMAGQNALVEHLSAVETLGATTVILTDKTGTLTENRMTVRRLWLPSGEVAIGEAPPPPDGDQQLALLMQVAVLCNDAALDRPEDAGAGDPMEVALLRAGLEAGYRRADLLADWPLRKKRAFDAASRMMLTVHDREGASFYAVKGAPEAVLAACTGIAADGAHVAFAPALREAWLAHVAELAHHGLRILACAGKTAPGPDAPPYEGLTFYGLIGLEDPARLDVPHAIAACHRAGIKVVMATGDHAATARSIGRAVGLRASEDAVAVGAAAALMEPEDLDRIAIFARVSPKEKLDLVRAYQAGGEIVAMTGDGVNDAPALRQADIGVAMGLRGTDVAREAAAMILLDDAFPTIVAAIREGRIIFGNIRRFAAYLFACNLAEVLVVGLAVLAAQPLPLLPLQILYLNLITDVFPAFALALGEGEGDVLARPPRPPTEQILGRPQWLRIGVQSVLMTIATFAATAIADGDGAGQGTVVTVTFLTLAFAQLWQVFNMRSARAPVLVNEITRNPWVWAALGLCSVLLAVPPYVPPLATVLGLVPPDARIWGVVLGCSLGPMLVWQAVLAIAGRRR